VLLLGAKTVGGTVGVGAIGLLLGIAWLIELVPAEARFWPAHDLVHLARSFARTCAHLMSTAMAAVARTF
jgi:hypothetical protein